MTMADFNGVQAAIEKLNGTSVDGKKVTVELSKPQTMNLAGIDSNTGDAKVELSKPNSLDTNIDDSSMGPSINYVARFSRFITPFLCCNFLKFNSLQEACAKSFGVHLLRFEILQTT